MCLDKSQCTIDQTRRRSQNVSDPVKLGVLVVGVALGLSGGVVIDRLDFLLEKKVVENLLSAEVFSS